MNAIVDIRSFRVVENSTGERAMSCTNGAENFSRAGFVRALAKAFPAKAAANLAAITGQSLRAAQMQASGEADPSAEALYACIAALGPEFLMAIAPGATWAAPRARDADIEHALDILSGALAKTPRRRTG